jgi:hypothetical protein
VLRKSEAGVHNEEEAQQFISLVAHYVNYIKKSKLTQNAIAAMFKHKEALAGDKVLVDEADKIIEQMKLDTKKVVRYAKSKSINVDAYQFQEGGRSFTPEESLSFHLSMLNQFLALPSDEQFIGEVPRQISNLRSVLFEAQDIGGNNKTIEKMRTSYSELSSEYEKKLKLQKVYLDYLRIQDYRALEAIWREIYQEGNRDEQMLFYFEYGDLFEKNRNYVQAQQVKADELVSKHMTHLQRLHNHLIDEIESVPANEKFMHWLAEHFGPTFVSVVIIIVLYLLLNRIGIKVDIDTIRKFTGS